MDSERTELADEPSEVDAVAEVPDEEQEHRSDVPLPPTAPPTPGALAVVADQLTVDYRPHPNSPRLTVLHKLSFDVPRGSVTAVIGPSGSGKTTLARTLGELRKRTQHEIVGGGLTVNGHRVRWSTRRGLDRLRVSVGSVQQDDATRLDGQLTVAELVAQPILVRDKKWDRRDLEYRVASLIDRVHLPLAVLDKFPYELSSGQRQRVSIARSLVLEPAVWVADEPGRGVDATLGNLIPQLIEEERAKRPFTAVVVSHEFALDPIVDQVLVLDAGRLVASGAPRPLFREGTAEYLVALRKELERS